MVYVNSTLHIYDLYTTVHISRPHTAHTIHVRSFTRTPRVLRTTSWQIAHRTCYFVDRYLSNHVNV